MYKLVIADEEGSTSTVPVIRDEITIGREDGNTIRLTERDVSRRHARVLRENGRIFVEDIAARYGIRKNGVKITQRVEFSPGDVLSIGGYQLTLKAKVEPGAPAKPPTPAARPPATEGTQILPAMPAKLVVISSNFAGQEFPLNRKEMIVGRGEDCDIIIDHRSVSQKHAKIIREQGNRYQIVDLNSKNGIIVAGSQYKAVQIKRGDVLELGHVKFRFVEPGENYVFTPQAAAAGDESQADEPARSSKMLPIGLVLVALLLGAGAGAFFLMNGNNAKPDSEHALASNSYVDPSTPPAPLDTAAIHEAADDSRVGQAIQEASADIRAGELDKAIGALDSANKYLNPTAEQRNAIAELIGTANNEKPFKKNYQAAQNFLSAENYSASLEQVSRIPAHSIFHKLLRDEGMMDKALDGLVATGEKALKADNEKDARKMAEEALLYNDEHVGALALLASLDERKTRVAVAVEQPTRPASNRAASSSAKPSAPAANTISAAQAKELLTSAQKKVFQNDPAGAIADCKSALRGGQSACYRVVGLAYKMQGNNSAACNNFKRYLSTKPSDADSVQRQMEQIGCQ